MYRFRLLFIVAAVFAFACRSKPDTKADRHNRQTADFDNMLIRNSPSIDFFKLTPHLKTYYLSLADLSTTNAENITNAVNKFEVLFKKDDTLVRDTACFMFNTFHLILAAHITDSLHIKPDTPGFRSDSLLASLRKRHPESKSPYRIKQDSIFKTNGFMVYKSSQEIYIVPNYDFEAKLLKDKVSMPMREYLMQKAKWTRHGWGKSKPEEIVDYTVDWELFFKKYPSILASNSAKTRWRDGVSALLTSPDIVVHHPFGLSKEYLTIYNYLQSRFPDSQTNKIVNPYFKLVAKKDSVGAQQLLDAYNQKYSLYSLPEQ